MCRQSTVWLDSSLTECERSWVRVPVGSCILRTYICDILWPAPAVGGGGVGGRGGVTSYIMVCIMMCGKYDLNYIHVYGCGILAKIMKMGLQIVIFRLKNIDLGAKYGKNYNYGPKNHLLAGADPGFLDRGFKIAEGWGRGVRGRGFDLCSLTNFS